MTYRPRIDLHRHLDGNVRLKTILDLGRKHGVDLPAWDEAGLRPHAVVMEPQPGLMAFLEKFQWTTAVLGAPEDCERVAFENMEDADRERLDYVELRFSPWFMASGHGLDAAEVTASVVAGVARGREVFGREAGLIGILSRTFGPDVAWEELEALLTCREALVAVDLAGDEAGWPARLFEPHFRRVREAGLRVTIHAGEAAGPESIWEAIELLGAERIGHATRAPEDPALLDYLQSQRIGLECNLTSNLQTSTIPDYASHPLKRFLEQGLLATINTDDPAISGIDLDYELETAALAAGLQPDQIQQACRNAETIAFR